MHFRMFQINIIISHWVNKDFANLKVNEKYLNTSCNETLLHKNIKEVFKHMQKFQGPPNIQGLEEAICWV